MAIKKFSENPVETTSPQFTDDEYMGYETDTEGMTKIKASVLGAKVVAENTVDNLTSTDTNKALSANQGKVLKDAQDVLNGDVATEGSVLKSINDEAENGIFTDTSGLDSTILADAINEIYAEKGQASGLASLDATGKVPASQLPVSAMEYKGAWDASSGAYPANPDTGDFWSVSTAGTTSEVNYDIGDAVVYNGEDWDKLTRVEIAKEIVYDNSESGLESEDVQDAIDEVQSNVESLAGVDNTSTVKANADAINTIKGPGWDGQNLADHESRITVLENSRVHRYGMKMNKTTGAVTRTYEAVGKVYRQQIDTITTPSDFSYLYPWSGIITVKVDADKNILCTINDSVFSTTVGDTMVLIPVFWSRYYTDDDYEYIDIADAPIDGFKAEGFYNPDGTIKLYTLVASIFTSNDGSTPHSWTDTPFKISHPLYNATNGFQIDALNKSATNKWSNINASVWEMLLRLSAVEICGSTNSASGYNVKGAIGQGINGLSNSYSASNVCTVATSDANTFIMAKTRSQYFAVGMLVQIGTAYTSQNIAANRNITDISEYDESNDTITVDGATFTTTTSSTIATWGQPLPEAQLLALKNESGYVLQFGAENKSHVCYRGIWDLWGNIWCFMSGLYRYDLEFYRAWDITKMNMNDPRGQAGWAATGVAPDVANGYLKNRQVYSGELGEIGLPQTTGGGAGSTTYWGAYNYYFNSSYMGLGAVHFGGSWRYGESVSLSSWLGSITPSNTGISICGRLIG